MHISDISLIQFCRIISAFYHMQLGIIRIIVDAIIVKGHQHSLIDRVRERQFIRHIIIADLVDIPAVHSFRRRRQTEQKLRLKIIHDLTIRIVDRMMKFVNHNVVKIIPRKIILIQIFRLSERHDRRKNYRLVRTFIRPSEKAIVIGIPDIMKCRRRLI